MTTARLPVLACFIAALLAAALGPHCGAMFAGRDAHTAIASHDAHVHHGHDAPAPAEPPDDVCAAMAAPDGVAASAATLEPPALVAIEPAAPACPARLALARTPDALKPPWATPPPGAAAIFATTHRLLI